MNFVSKTESWAWEFSCAILQSNIRWLIWDFGNLQAEPISCPWVLSISFWGKIFAFFFLVHVSWSSLWIWGSHSSKKLSALWHLLSAGQYCFLSSVQHISSVPIYFPLHGAISLMSPGKLKGLCISTSLILFILVFFFFFFFWHLAEPRPNLGNSPLIHAHGADIPSFPLARHTNGHC